jgi:hypothetical protein
MFASLMLQKTELKNNTRFFQLLLRCYREGDAENAVRVIRELVEHDERFALQKIAELQS